MSVRKDRVDLYIDCLKVNTDTGLGSISAVSLGSVSTVSNDSLGSTGTTIDVNGYMSLGQKDNGLTAAVSFIVS